MILSETQVLKLLLNPPKLTQLGFSMLVTRLSALYAKNSSPDILKQCTSEINSFLSKFDSIMSNDDYTAVSTLLNVPSDSHLFPTL